MYNGTEKESVSPSKQHILDEMEMSYTCTVAAKIKLMFCFRATVRAFPFRVRFYCVFTLFPLFYVKRTCPFKRL